VSYRRPSKNSTRTSEQEISLLGFASSAHYKIVPASLVRIVFCLDRFGINIDDILV